MGAIGIVWSRTKADFQHSVRSLKAGLIAIGIDALAGGPWFFIVTDNNTSQREAAAFTALAILAGPGIVFVGSFVRAAIAAPFSTIEDLLGDAEDEETARAIRRLGAHCISGTSVTLLDCFSGLREQLSHGLRDSHLSGMAHELGLRVHHHYSHQELAGALIRAGVVAGETRYEPSLIREQPVPARIYHATELGLKVARALERKPPPPILPRPHVRRDDLENPKRIRLQIENVGAREWFRVKVESIYGWGRHEPQYHVPWERTGEKWLELDHGENDHVLLVEVRPLLGEEETQVVLLPSCEHSPLTERRVNARHAFLNISLAIYGRDSDVLPVTEYVHLKWEDGVLSED